MDSVIYLDNAATSYPKPEEVHDFMGSFYRTCGVNPGRSGCDMALQAEEMIRETRQALSRFFNPSLSASGSGKDPDRLVFTINATHALNMVLRGTLRDGDHVVTTWMEHNSVIRPVNHLVRDHGVQASFLRPDPDGRLDPEEVRKAIQPNTRLVMVNHASNVTGVVQDIHTIGSVCAEAGVAFAVDTAQTAGVLPIDMAECHISFLCFTGHKGLMGPTGTGGICVADDAQVASSVWGGTGVKSAHPFHLDEYPYRLEAGTLNLLGIAGLHAGQAWIGKRGLAAIHAHEMELCGLLLEGLSGIRGVRVIGPRTTDWRVATVSLTVEGYDPSDVGTILDVDHNIITRTGLQCAPLAHDHMGTSPRGGPSVSPSVPSRPARRSWRRSGPWTRSPIRAAPGPRLKRADCGRQAR
ncbi:MAG: aminotransferase class V-fold PLP-dependent enzyme [Acidobacteriota bacterium]